MSPRDKFKQERDLAKVRRDLPLGGLIQALNGDWKEPFSFRRVNISVPIAAMRLIRQLAGYANVVSPQYFRITRPNHATKLLGELNQLLGRYMAVPHIRGIQKGIWERIRLLDGPLRYEELMISKIIDLAEAGEIDRLRQCQFCSRWFFAKQPNQNCCKKECGQKLLGADKTKREARNASRRKNRQAEYQRATAQKNAKPWPDEWIKGKSKK